MSSTEAARWIETLGLARHPEGGWFREIYRSTERIARASLPSRFTGDRAYSTAIYFLLDAPEQSSLHRIRQDELWHFYEGAPLTLHVIDGHDRYSSIRLGRHPPGGETLVAVIEAGCLFGATVEPGTYALAGCTVAPGFDFDDFELPDADTLLTRYPMHRALIERLAVRRAPR